MSRMDGRQRAQPDGESTQGPAAPTLSATVPPPTMEGQTDGLARLNPKGGQSSSGSPSTTALSLYRDWEA